MKRQLLRSTAFVRAARRVAKRNPGVVDELRTTLELLSEDAFNTRLRTHKLKGPFADSWACSVSYEIRIVFTFVEFEGAEAILLQTVGTHEEVY
jgi:addiction module RelE/StbE family toxin